METQDLYPLASGETVPVGSVIAGLFADEGSARQTIEALSALGLKEEQIAVAALDKGDQRDIIDGTEATALNKQTGMLPFQGAFVEGVARLLGGGRGAANIVFSSLVSMGFTEEQARYYEKGYEAGQILVTVEPGIMAKEAFEILGRNAADIGPVSTVTGPDFRADQRISTSGSTPSSTGPAGLNPTEI